MNYFNEKKLLETITKYAYDAMFITDSEGMTVFINDSYNRITGYSGPPQLGQKATYVKELGFLKNMIFDQVFKDHRPTSMLLEYCNNDRDILATAIPIFDDDGNYAGFVCNSRDMTELIELKNKLAFTKKKYAAARAELEKLNIDNDIQKNYIAKSQIMKKLVLLAEKIAKVNTTILITGESGVGKDNYAQLIHQFSSGGTTQPLIKISCGAIPATLLESELFGYKEGAFTGARKGGKPGAFELAEEGIIFLDEIGELPLDLQVKLLNVIQDREFYSLGGTTPTKMNARVIAATNKDLAKSVEDGEFRQDLYYRLNVIPIEIPPLRERREDILPLTLFFLSQLNEKYNFARTFDNNVIRSLEVYNWPGNIRELSNVVERLAVLSTTDIIDMEQFAELTDLDYHKIDLSYDRNLNLKDFLDQAECHRILQVLEQADSFQDAADKLAIDPSTLTRKIQKHGISTTRRDRAKYFHKTGTD